MDLIQVLVKQRKVVGFQICSPTRNKTYLCAAGEECNLFSHDEFYGEGEAGENTVAGW